MTEHDPTVARIGPNSITRMAQALRHQHDEPLTTRIFEAAGLTDHLTHPPTTMVDERDVTALHRALREALSPEQAAAVSLEAGHLTGDYLLANRIPKPVQSILKLLPAGPSSRILLKAIERNAWTFTGSGQFQVSHRPNLTLTITNSPLCRDAQSAHPVCDYYAGTFQRLFQVLVHPETRVTETQCAAAGVAHCVFEVRWR
ncbi:bacteriochlorophyll 4-vinyl reductase [Ectothiorhodospira variabilis]|uniref:bacteriochlorophyll 4-vinyl reductase n=1 Tax=Ectothiorhodospira variabilis TaxID=505694 RepID=UPI001EFC1EFB|nr:bacteriochlorophyll 4-vinyl reductase [Ectothiorhodospira variabilis]MCG5498580.1 bacteriochlorophyll 4-vinyl reductase [Ectothiorhodospira variabilis]